MKKIDSETGPRTVQEGQKKAPLGGPTLNLGCNQITYGLGKKKRGGIIVHHKRIYRLCKRAGVPHN